MIEFFRNPKQHVSTVAVLINNDESLLGFLPEPTLRKRERESNQETRLYAAINTFVTVSLETSRFVPSTNTRCLCRCHRRAIGDRSGALIEFYGSSAEGEDKHMQKFRDSNTD